MIFEKIKKIISEQLKIDEENITRETSFEELGVDSLDLFQIIIEIEEEFGVQIEDAESIRTVEEAVDFVKGNIKK
ncbi:acyl carrier protein [Clostridium thailandense]|uniref:Acyl carrier protein n=1 Tax=Clostridium thailandense TaxID=2794346 RepID=A0A949TVM0_9CLOT|nr:acyl carrier protein [Clostridium thailandense]MBV7273263.1 acyl carrier protein [Clostridium thailandense]MCH5137288.1 acyl carrier protein [Clostridiaceae bacterium UIB06]